MATPREFIIEYLEQEHDLSAIADIDALDMVGEGYIDSMGMVQFVVLIEDEFGIYFDDVELGGSAFNSVGTLAALIESKMEA